jgi:hypothetical protein
VVSASREIVAEPGRIFELIADPAQQPRWDGNQNLAWAAVGQRVHSTGDVFTMTLTVDGSVRENHVTELEEGRRIAWMPPSRDSSGPGTCGGGNSCRPVRPAPRSPAPTTGPSRSMRTVSRGPGRPHPDRLRASLDRLAALAEES